MNIIFSETISLTHSQCGPLLTLIASVNTTLLTPQTRFATASHAQLAPILTHLFFSAPTVAISAKHATLMHRAKAVIPLNFEKYQDISAFPYLDIINRMLLQLLNAAQIAQAAH